MTGLDWEQALHAEPNGPAPEPAAEPTGPTPFALAIDEFIDLKIASRPPLLGDERNTLLPEGGLGIIGGREGVGKTTLILDLAFHLASGVDWLDLKVPRPCNVCLIENEGPKEMFRQKLQHKRERWEPPLTGGVYVHTWDWGLLSFARKEARERAAEFFDAKAVDIIIGDPLDSLGTVGHGSPRDVDEFTHLLKQVGLNVNRAFIFLQHFNRGDSDEEVNQLAGVWTRPADLYMTVKQSSRPNELRLHLPKVRWARDTFKPIVIGMLRETAGFERLGDEGDPRLLEPELVELLKDMKWRTLTEVATEKAGGIGARRQDVEACLRQNGHLFAEGAGEEHGRKKGSRVWSLQPDAVEHVPESWTSWDELNSGDEGGPEGELEYS